MNRIYVIRKSILSMAALTLVFAIGSSSFLAEGISEKNSELIDSVAQTLGNMTEMNANDQFTLYVDEKNAAFSVVDNKTGQTWHSIPPDLSGSNTEDELYANAASLVKLWYYNRQDEENVMLSYSDSVSKEQFTVEQIEHGVRFLYTMGRDGSASILPKAITEERMNQLILDPLDGNRQARRVQVVYRLISKEQAISPEDFQKDLEKYPILKEKNIYVLNEATQRELEEIEGIFREVGYTSDMCKQDNLETGQKGEDNSTPYFKIPLDIVLSEKGFTASIDASKIQYNKNFYLHKISLLEYFNAAKTGENARLFYPDGCGILLDLGSADNPSIVTSITKPVYGENYALQAQLTSGVEQVVRLPVFGIIKENQASLAVIAQGEATARLTATISDSSNPYNRNYAAFMIHEKDQFDFGDVAGAGYKWTVFEKQGYQKTCEIEYILLPKENANIGGLAAAYQEILFKGKAVHTEQCDIPFYLETLGTFYHKDKLLGFSINRKTALTTYDQALEMLNDLSKSGIHNISLKYAGWANGGLSHTAFSSIKPESKLGGKKDLKNLSLTSVKDGYRFFPDIDFQFIDKDSMFDAFSANNHTIRTLDKKLGGYVALNLSDYLPNKDSFRNAVSTDIAFKFASNISDSLHKFKLSTISSASLGDSLFSNFSEKRYQNRQTSCDQLEKIAQMLGNNKDFMTSGGNAFVLPYTTDVLSVPSISSEYSLRHETVPFMQMVLHGYVDYAGDAVNLSGDYRTALLRAALNGEAAYFVLNNSNTKYLRETQYSQYYSTNYKDWKEEAVLAYNKLNQVLKSVSNLKMTGFKKISESVYQTEYSSGKAIVVNFGDDAFQGAKYRVESMDFVLVE